MPSDRPRSRSPSRRRSRSPARSSYRSQSTTHREDSHRDSYRSSDRYPGERAERDYEGTRPARPRSRSPTGGSHSQRDDRRDGRDRDRRRPEPISAGKEFRGEVRNDGTWEGRRASGVEVRTRSPGRPSQGQAHGQAVALPSQDAAFGKPEGAESEERKKMDVVEPNYKPSGALAAETK